jgi:pilus assembly protein Flp/PilA
MFCQPFRRFLGDETAATAVEYAVLLALILMAVIGSIANFGSEAGGMWGGIKSDLDATPFAGGS